jgi:hypothetical protein
MGYAPRIDRIDRNFIINSNMEFWQRVVGNTSTVNDATSANLYTADRFLCGRSGPTVKNFSIVRSTDVPSVSAAGGRIPYSYQFSCLTAIASPAAADIVQPLQTRLEGYDYADLYDKEVTFGVWVKLTAPSVTFPVTNFPMSMQTATHSYVTHVQIDANDTWQFVTFTLDMGTFGSVFDHNLALRVSMAGSTGTSSHASSLNTWLPEADRFAVSGSFNIMGFNTNVLKITGLRLVIGPSVEADAFMRAGRSRAEELLMCQRYYEKSYDTNVTPGSNTPVGLAMFASTVLNNYPAYIPFAVQKRDTPILSIWDRVGNSGKLTTMTGGAVYTDNVTTSPGTIPGHSNRAIAYNVAGQTGSFVASGFHWVAEAEL